MVNLDSIDSREDFKWDLIRKAHKESDFRYLLRSDPQAALKKMMAGDAATDVQLSVHQEKPTEIFFLVNYHPGLPAAANDIRIDADDVGEAILVKKAWKDPAYRAALLSDPAKKYSQEFGQPVPRGTSLRVLEERRNELHLILPSDLNDQDTATQNASELSEAQLDTVAGGCFMNPMLKAWNMLTGSGSSDSDRSSSHLSGCYSASGVRG